MWKITSPNIETSELPELLELVRQGEPSEQEVASANAQKAQNVWIASEYLSFTDCEIPAKQKAMAHKMVAFSLEDQVLDPIEKLHFALGPMQDNSVPVVIASDPLMQEWLDLCKQKDIRPQNFLPDIYALPYEEGRMTIWHENDRCLLRDGEHSGFAGSLDWILRVAELQNKASASHSTQLDIYSDAVDKLPEAWRQNARPLLAPLDEMMLRFEEKSPINLLQGVYALESPVAQWVIPWRAAALFAIAAVGLHIAIMMYETQILDQRTTTIKSDTFKLFKTIDESGKPGNVRQQLMQYFQLLQERRIKNEESAWSIFTAVDPAISRCKACRVESLKFAGKKLRIRIKSEGDFSALKQELAELPLVKSDFRIVRETDKFAVARITLSLNDG